jgi:hypothetical protein
MIIYFHIDELGRDAIVASALRKVGLANGWHVVYGNRHSSVLLSHLNIFDAIILPSHLHFKHYFPDFDKLPNNVFILPTEAVGQATGSLRRINAKYFGVDEIEDAPWHKAVRGFLLWGFAHLNPFREFHPEYLKRCSVVGHPRLSQFTINSAKSRRRTKKTIGFISRFGKLNCFDQRGNMSLIYDGMKKDDQIHAVYENSPEMDIEDLFYTETIDLRIMFLIMKALKDNDQYEFVVKPYPREDVGQWHAFVKKYGIKARIFKWDMPFAAWLSEVDYIISPPSTSFYDIIAQGRTPICTDRIVAKRAEHILTESDDNNQILRYVYRPASLNELLESIKEDRIPDLADGYSAVLEGQAALSIAGDSIRNIFDALGSSISAGEINAGGIRVRLGLLYYWSMTLIRAYFAKVRDWVKRVDEQGSSFYLTIGRIFWIDRLSDSVMSVSAEDRG